jgi:hypothetical protein
VLKTRPKLFAAAEQFQNVAFELCITNLLGLKGVLPNLEL